jgi:polysaccharide export outer membrane protein
MRKSDVARLALGIWAALAVSIAGTGCQSHLLCPPEPGGDVPREMAMASLPPYTINPPDILLIDAVRLVPLPPYRLAPSDAIAVQFPAKPLPEKDLETLEKAGLTITGILRIDPEGTVRLGLKYGTVSVTGLTLEEARTVILKRIEPEVRKALIEQGDILVELAEYRGLQQVRGEHLVRPDGTVGLGTYGEVSVAGLTLTEAKATIEQHLGQFMLKPEISLDVSGYNSKVYFVVFDQGGFGMQIVRLPVTGSDTVLDALGLVNGLTPVSSKFHVWVARPGPPGCDGEQLLPVDLNAVVKRGKTSTNYMLFPGDRIYVKADSLITIDNYLTKIVTPIERVFGLVLLGNATVRGVAGHTGGTTTGGTGTVGP